MHLSLKRRKGDSLPIDTDIAIWLILGDNPVAQHLPVRDARVAEELVGFDGEHHLDGCEARDVTIYADEVHEAVVGEGGGEEVGV